MNHLRTHLFLILIKDTIHLYTSNMISSLIRIFLPGERIWVLLSPSFTNNTQDFCLQEISSKEAKWATSPLIWVRRVCYSCKRPNKSSLTSKTYNSDKRLFFLNVKSPNSSLFHFLKSSLWAFNLRAKIKLGESKTKYPFHHCRTLSTKPSSFNHIFSNLKATFIDTTSYNQKWTMIKNYSREHPLSLLYNSLDILSCIYDNVCLQ